MSTRREGVRPVIGAGAEMEGHPDQIKVILRDGQSLLMRPALDEDKIRVEAFFYGLSRESRRLRFHSPKETIGKREVAELVKVDPPGRFSYVAVSGEGDEEQIVGLGSWGLTPSGAEVGFMVAEDIQVRGVGTALLEQLAVKAVRYRITRFIAHVLPENTRMMEVLEHSGFPLAKKFSGGVYHVMLDLTEKGGFVRSRRIREHCARSAGVKRVMNPSSVAVIGASRNPSRIGGSLFLNITRGGYRGKVFPVNPRASSIGGFPAYPSVLDVPGDVDLAVIVVPSEEVLSVAEQCGKKGVRGLVIISAGFSETGGVGREREGALLHKVCSYGMRAIGPNSLGIINAGEEFELNATFSPNPAPRGRVSMGTQSGALGIALLDHAHNFNIGFAHFVSLGNQMDISSNDLLEYWEDDENTGVILLYVESFGDPRDFGTIARRVTRKKPIVAVKSGRSDAGARAASSHTGALAAHDVAVDAMFDQAGVIRVDTLEEMFNLAELLTYQPLPAGPNVGILTNAGGPGILVADACAGAGLTVPALSNATRERLRAGLPPEASLANPVDMIASATPMQYRDALSALLDEGNIDAVIVIYIPVLVTRPEDIAGAVKDTMTGYGGEKPVLASFMMARKMSVDLGTGPGKCVPNYTFPEDAAKALSRAYQYRRILQREEGTVPLFPDLDREAAGKGLASLVPGDGGEAWLTPDRAMQVLRWYGIPTVGTHVARTCDEAVQRARKTGFPVVMKVRSSSITHKTEVGGVVLGLSTEGEVAKSFLSMQERFGDRDRGGGMEGVVIQPLLKGGVEIIAGMSHDPLFGPIMMVGLGGVEVELFRDVAFSLHPVTDVDAERMLARLKSFPLLEGWRGRPAMDREAVLRVLLRLSALVGDFPEISEIEINPLLLFERGRGCLAVDARVCLKGR